MRSLNLARPASFLNGEPTVAETVQLHIARREHPQRMVQSSEPLFLRVSLPPDNRQIRGAGMRGDNLVHL